jgi:hypothetical protein
MKRTKLSHHSQHNFVSTCPTEALSVVNPPASSIEMAPERAATSDLSSHADSIQIDPFFSRQPDSSAQDFLTTQPIPNAAEFVSCLFYCFSSSLR